MNLEEIKTKTKEATDYLVQSLEAGHREVLTQSLGAMAKSATSGAPDPPAAVASPPSDRGATAAAPAIARMARRMPNKIDRTAVPPARIRTFWEMAMVESLSRPGVRPTPGRY